MRKIALITAALAACLSFPGSGSCAWEKLRSSDAPLAVVYASTGDYSVAYTVGENCASPYNLVNSPNSVLSGYLSLIPSSLENQGFYGIDSTSGVMMEGTLWGAPPDDTVKLLFATDISTSLSSPGITVTRIMTSTNSEMNESWPVTLTYSGQKLVIVPSSAWPKGSVFSVYYSSSIIDINGSPLSGATTLYFSILMDYQAENTASPIYDRKVRVLIPANAYAEDFFLTLSTNSGTPEIKAANLKLGSLPGSPEFVNSVAVRPYDAAGNPVQPNSACVVTLPYPDANGDGIVDGSGAQLTTSDLAVWMLDEDKQLWVKQTGASLDRSGKHISLPVGHFSSYALMGLPDTNPDLVYAYPVPFRPNVGDTARYGSWNDLITFTNLPAHGKIKIYAISGELVRSMDITAPSMKWDIKNSARQTVASGVYIWEVTVDNNRKTGKLVIIK